MPDPSPDTGKQRPNAKRALAACLIAYAFCASLFGIQKFSELRIESDTVSVESFWGGFFGWFAFSDSFFSLVCLTALSLLAYRLLRRMPGSPVRVRVLGAAFGAAFASSLVVGTSLFEENAALPCAPVQIACILCAWPCLSLLFACLFDVVARGPMAGAPPAPPAPSDAAEGGPAPRKRLPERLLARLAVAKHPALALAALAFALWLPAYLGLFPGVYAYDAIIQVGWMEEGYLTSYHPLLHSAFLYGCIEAGRALLGSPEAGLAAYSLVQMAAMALICGYLGWFCIDRFRLGWAGALAVLAFVMLYPATPLLAVSATKDTLFAGFFALTVAGVADAALDEGSFFSRRRNALRIAAPLFLMCLLRNNGVYAAAVLVPFFLVWAFARRRAPIAATAGKPAEGAEPPRSDGGNRLLCCEALVAAVVLAAAVLGPIQTALGVQPSPAREALSVPIQQLSRVLAEGEDVDPQDRDAIEAYIPDWRDYNPRIADPAKATFDNGLFEEDPLAFIALWARVGLEHPAAYLDAWASMTFGYWYTDMAFPDPATGHPYLAARMTDPSELADPEGYLFIQQDSKLPIAGKLAEAFAHGTPFRALPGLSLLFAPATFVWTMLACAGCCIAARRTRLALAIVLPAGLLATLFLGPVVLLRYAYPFILCSPLFVLIPWKIAGRGRDRLK